MKTILIGFSRSVGTFTSRQTGEEVSYSNRTLRFITNSGENKDNIGFEQFSAEKMKLSVLAQILKVQETDEAVDKALNELINRPVNTQFAPVGGALSLVWFAAEK